MVVAAPQSFQFSRSITRFFRNNRALPKFKYRILYYLVTTFKSQKKLVCKSRFFNVFRKRPVAWNGLRKAFHTKHTAQKISFPLRISSVNVWKNPLSEVF